MSKRLALSAAVIVVSSMTSFAEPGRPSGHPVIHHQPRGPAPSVTGSVRHDRGPAHRRFDRGLRDVEVLPARGFGGGLGVFGNRPPLALAYPGSVIVVDQQNYGLVLPNGSIVSRTAGGRTIVTPGPAFDGYSYPAQQVDDDRAYRVLTPAVGSGSVGSGGAALYEVPGAQKGETPRGIEVIYGIRGN